MMSNPIHQSSSDGLLDNLDSSVAVHITPPAASEQRGSSTSLNSGNEEMQQVRARLPSYNEAMREESRRAEKRADDSVAIEMKQLSHPDEIIAAPAKSGGDGDGDDDSETDADGKKKKKKDAEKVPFKELLLRFATPFDKLLMCLGLLGSLGAGGSLPGMTIIFGEMIDVFTEFSQTDDRDKFDDGIFEFTMWFVGLAIFAWITSYLQMACWMIAGERITKTIRIRYVKAMLRQDIGWFDTQKAGDLTTRIQSDTFLIQEAVGEKVGVFFQHFTTFFAGFVIAFVRGWQLALVLLAVIPFLAVCGGFFSKMLASATTKGQKAYAGAGAIAEEVLSSIRTVASFSGEPLELTRYAGRLIEAYTIGVRKARASGLGIGVTFFIMFLAYALAFWFGSIMIDQGHMTSGGVLNVFFAVIIGAFSLGHAGPPIAAFGVGMGAAFHVFKVIDRVPPIDSESTEGAKPSTVKGDISLRDVHFHYATRAEVKILKGISIDIPSGQTVALVGASGCGKSTIISLIERFYDPVEGQVFLDGQDIKSLNLHWLRETVGIVSQEPVLFNMTIQENIRLGKPTATDEEIYQACRNSNIHDFIMSLPEAYRTPVGERGTQLSGGQKQRIAIARALIKNPRILLLDEATSALDNESERIVQDALDKASVGRTTIVIAHRLSTVRNADKIIVLGGGNVIEQGSHAELMAIPDGAFVALVEAQALHAASKKEGEDEEQGNSLDVPGGAADPTRRSVDATRRSANKMSGTGAAIGGTDAAATTDKDGAKAGADGKDELDPDAKAKAAVPEDYKVPLSRILKLNRPELGLLILGMIGAAVNGVVMPVFAILFSEILDVFSKTGDDLLEGARFWAGMFVVLAVVTGVANYMQTYFFGVSGERLTLRLREMSFQAMLRQNIAFFDMPANATGALTARLAVDASMVQGMAGSRFGTLTQVAVNLLAGVIIAFVAGWKLTLVILACIPLIMFAGALQMKALGGFSAQGKLAYQKSGKVASEAIENARTVTTLNKQAFFLSNFEHELVFPYHLGVKKSHVAGVGFGFSQAMMFFTYAVAFYYGGVLVGDGEQTFPEMIRTFTAIVFSAMAAGQMSTLATDADKARIACYNIFELLDRKSEVDPMSQDGTRVAVQSATVELKDLHFSYPERPDIPILQGLSLNVPAGHTVALVGASGCGKSTVIGMLERFYNPKSGTLLLDGQDISTMNVTHLRSQLGLVSQEPVLFGTSIEENIRYGKLDATDEEIVEAARNANIHNFISALPEGYKTQVGERGTQLSGGQKQRIAIARALIRNPKVILLDEATSALDSESEKIVQEALDRASKGRTTIVIAHRLSTIQDADMIVVFHKGKVAEQGTHDELLHKRGLYYKLATSQAKHH
ncbi:multidrug resistance protein 1a [Capsaspora owczarzaki ATCC 30864]|uniref:Multidrug resistance protein 1a n=1 Tax=Capsaspora owczarzaki (strain ATCC 30864) TaxID=595528 RepID=A0A0D2U039_CAPO3|nr:multidrug resistance protein 1a [Capsaspora owczarzaki ATCC 30864]KJE88541.1 multidrug resistance protein 1a [Capsaspora owczarzaki ATCC 30864]|eukprot:XP_004365053.2 multidrug resistance protein 1a [Capsaspora owczarzaki ATCC 30864]